MKYQESADVYRTQDIEYNSQQQVQYVRQKGEWDKGNFIFFMDLV